MDFTELVKVIREDYQLPPYLSDDTVKRSLIRAYNFLLPLNPDADFFSSPARDLLLNGAYYDIQHKFNEFAENYGPDIRHWQLNTEVNG